MFRLVNFAILVISALSAGLIGIGLLLGAVLPSGEQVVFTQSRLDQWTKIALLDLNRSLPVNRFLPIRVGPLQWSGDGERLMVSGGRNTRTRYYSLGYNPLNPRTEWLTTIEQASMFNPYVAYSPDMQWVAIPVTKDGNGIEIELEAAYTGQTLDYTFSQQAVTGGAWALGQMMWTADSRKFIYSKMKVESNTFDYNYRSITYYYVIDAVTGEKTSITDEPVYEMQLSPNGKYIYYSVMAKRTLPSQNRMDYSPSYLYYVYDLESGTRHLISEQPIYQLLWSPDGEKIAFATTAPPSTPRELSIVERVLSPTVPWYYSNSIGFAPSYSSYPQQMGFYPGGSFSIQYTPSYYIPYGNGQPIQTLVMDMETGARQEIDTKGLGTMYTMQWLNSGEGLLLGIQRAGLQRVLAQTLRIPINDIYLISMENPTPQLLRYEDKSLTVVQVAPKGDQILLRSQNSPDFYLYYSQRGEIVPINLNREELLYPTWSPDGQYLILMTNIPYPPQAASMYPTLIPGTTALPSPVPIMNPTPTIASPGLMIQIGTVTPPVPMYRLYLVKPDSAQPYKLLDISEPYGFYWSPNGRSAVYFNNENGRRILYLIEDVNQESITPRPIYSGDARMFQYGVYQLWRPRT